MFAACRQQITIKNFAKFLALFCIVLYLNVKGEGEGALIKKKIFLIYKENQMGAVVKSYMRKGFLNYEEMRKYLVIYKVAVCPI